MKDTKKEAIEATCQNCGGEVSLEVEFNTIGDGAAIYAECQDCNRAGWAGERQVSP